MSLTPSLLKCTCLMAVEWPMNAPNFTSYLKNCRLKQLLHFLRNVYSLHTFSSYRVNWCSLLLGENLVKSSSSPTIHIPGENNSNALLFRQILEPCFRPWNQAPKLLFLVFISSPSPCLCISLFLCAWKNFHLRCQISPHLTQSF